MKGASPPAACRYPALGHPRSASPRILFLQLLEPHYILGPHPVGSGCTLTRYDAVTVL